MVDFALSHRKVAPVGISHDIYGFQGREKTDTHYDYSSNDHLRISLDATVSESLE